MTEAFLESMNNRLKGVLLHHLGYHLIHQMAKRIHKWNETKVC